MEHYSNIMPREKGNLLFFCEDILSLLIAFQARLGEVYWKQFIQRNKNRYNSSLSLVILIVIIMFIYFT